MMKIIHLSDLHFGTERADRVSMLEQDIQSLKPDLVIISGDLTQRATHAQYATVKAFIDNLHIPTLCVPGNHDIPLYNLFIRLLSPFSKYKSWIAPLCTHFEFKDIVILGINSVTPFKPMGGYITEKQLGMVTEFFKTQTGKIKIVVMHHNLIRSERHKIINDSEKIISLFAKSNVNLVLSGHIHSPHIELLKRNYLSHPMYVITAGTAVSNRTIAPNSYNVIDIHEKNFTVNVRDFMEGEFVTTYEGEYLL